MSHVQSSHEGTVLRAVDFFCGAGGMSYGLSQAGIRVLGGVDNAADCQLTYETNIPGAKYVHRDVTSLSSAELARQFDIRRNDPNLLFTGCSPCQFWSKIRTDKTKSVQTAFLLSQFQRFIRYFRPGWVVIENVPGLYRRKDNAILRDFIAFLTNRGYNFKDGIVNAAHFGVPQNRLRYVMIASRVVEVKPLSPTHRASPLTVADFIGVENGFQTISHGHIDRTPFRHTTAALSDLNLRRIAKTPLSGGDRSAWPRRRLQPTRCLALFEVSG